MKVITLFFVFAFAVFVASVFAFSIALFLSSDIKQLIGIIGLIVASGITSLIGERVIK